MSVTSLSGTKIRRRDSEEVVDGGELGVHLVEPGRRDPHERLKLRLLFSSRRVLQAFVVPCRGRAATDGLVRRSNEKAALTGRLVCGSRVTRLSAEPT